MLGTLLLDSCVVGDGQAPWPRTFALDAGDGGLIGVFEKGEAVQGLAFGLVDRGTGEPVTSGVCTAFVTLDNGLQQPLAAVPVHKGNGQWTVDLTADETNADVVGLLFLHHDAFPVSLTFHTVDYEDEFGSVLLGPGADRCTVTVLADGVPVADADVWVSIDPAGAHVVAGVLQTDSEGKRLFLLDAGNTYYLWWQKDGWNSILGQRFIAEADD